MTATSTVPQKVWVSIDGERPTQFKTEGCQFVSDLIENIYQGYPNLFPGLYPPHLSLHKDPNSKEIDVWELLSDVFVAPDAYGLEGPRPLTLKSNKRGKYVFQRFALRSRKTRNG